MSITGLRTWVDGETITAAKLNADNSVLVTKFNAGVTTADLHPHAAGITNAQLAYSKYETILSMTVTGAQWASPTADNDVVALVGLPADVNAESYTILGIDYAYVNAGTASSGTPDFAVDWGYFPAAAPGTFVQTTRLVAPVGITASCNVRGAAVLAATTVTTDTSATGRQFFAIIATDVADGATRPFGVNNEFLTVTIKLTRTHGLRG